MVSRTFKVGQAFGKRGVLSRATQASPEAIGDRDDFAPYWDSNGTYLDRPTFSAAQSFTAGNSAAARVTNRITLAPTAVDPEGFPLSYTVDTIPANPTQLDSVSVTGNSFRFTPAFGLLGDSQNNAGSFKARLRASDGPRDVLDVVTFTLGYTEDMHVPAGTTLLLGLSFNGGALGKSGSWGTPSGGPGSYPTSGGVLNNGYGTNISGSITVSELSSAGSGAGKTFVAWYKGSQTNGTNSVYSPGVPIFGHTSGSVHMGFGLEDGVLVVCGGSSATKGTTNLATNTWRMLAFTYSSSGHIINGYCDNGSGTMTKEITDKDCSSSASYNYLNHFLNGYGYGGYQQPTNADNIQVFDDILTQSQIQAIFDKGGGTNGGN
tara:strand:+ start:1536 stop:2666 length:1131 start_codon:yes stop_codon:yes gene_type:complete